MICVKTVRPVFIGRSLVKRAAEVYAQIKSMQVEFLGKIPAINGLQRRRCAMPGQQ
jgi:hypothetical protein